MPGACQARDAAPTVRAMQRATLDVYDAVTGAPLFARLRAGGADDIA
jgi:hypothetical protein